MNKIGFNVLVWSAVVSDELMPIADRLKKIGYDGVECLISSLDKTAYQRFGDHALNLGLETTCVFILGKEENPISASAAVRAKGLILQMLLMYGGNIQSPGIWQKMV